MMRVFINALPAVDLSIAVGRASAQGPDPNDILGPHRAADQANDGHRKIVPRPASATNRPGRLVPRMQDSLRDR
jgi:hypothetical protein